MNESTREDGNAPENHNLPFSRRRLLQAAGIGGAGLAIGVVAGCSSSGSASSSTASSTGSATTATTAAPSASGPKRNLVWATVAIGEWNLPVDVGFQEACNLVGWHYQKVGPPEAEAAPDRWVSDLQTLVQSKPDVVASILLTKGMLEPLKALEKGGTYVITSNAAIEPERTEAGWSYVGQDEEVAGYALGVRLLAELDKLGKKSGAIVAGNHSPGVVVTERRFLGLKRAVTEGNGKNATDFTVENWPDESAAKPAEAIGAYQTKKTQIGDSLVAFAGMGLTGVIASVKSARANGWKAGAPVLCGFDVSLDINDGINDGLITHVIDQQLYSIGFITAIMSWQWLERGFRPTSLYNTGSAIVDKSNIATILKRDQDILKKAQDYGLTA